MVNNGNVLVTFVLTIGFTHSSFDYNQTSEERARLQLPELEERIARLQEIARLCPNYRADYIIAFTFFLTLMGVAALTQSTSNSASYASFILPLGLLFFEQLKNLISDFNAHDTLQYNVKWKVVKTQSHYFVEPAYGFNDQWSVRLYEIDPLSSFHLDADIEPLPPYPQEAHFNHDSQPTSAIQAEEGSVTLPSYEELEMASITPPSRAYTMA
ncbi:uncharacterized protein VTP21DRAFT_1229 [Calcarisporiella thermophila]|uniref:uncharacterized protein n=1 Tax=Calcarisporiella thermophila TaxID=911321 RepID=UPI0037423049